MQSSPRAPVVHLILSKGQEVCEREVSKEWAQQYKNIYMTHINKRKKGHTCILRIPRRTRL